MSKDLHIKFGSFSDLIEEAKTAIKSGVGQEYSDIRFESYTSFMNFMFPNKFELLVAIKVGSPNSLYQLAQLVSRHQSIVLKECNELEALGFISYEEGARNSKKPTLSFDYECIVVHDSRGNQSHILPQAA